MKSVLAPLVLVFALVASRSSSAQTPVTAVKVVRPDKDRDQGYIYEVKIIDEFIERFNDDKTSYLRKEYKRAKHPFTFTRRKLIQSLFNNPKAWAGKPEVKKFINQVADSSQPQLLSITDSSWYAEVNCLFAYNGQQLRIPLIMQLLSLQDSGATWMITGIGNSPVFTHQKVKSGKVKEEAQTYKKSISPSDYATNFMALHRVLAPQMNPNNYFMPALLSTDRAAEFVELVKAGRLKFDHTMETKFYFFQVPNYVFTVENFTRPGLNSGWLINSLEAATGTEKTAQKEELLQRPL